MKTLVALLLVAGCVASALAGEAPPKFTGKPTAKKQNGKVRIKFAVDRKTDVAVYILDSKAKVVRHLVAGVLGKNPPKPLKPGLSQDIEWDGKADYGKPAGPGPFKVAVKLGTRPTFDRFLLYSKDARLKTYYLAVGPKGNVYYFHKDDTANGNTEGYRIKMMDRDGKHIRVLSPFPANIDYQRVKAVKPFRTKEGDLVPRVHNYMQRNFYPDPNRSRMLSIAADVQPTVDSKGRLYWVHRGPRIACIDAEGGIPHATFMGPNLALEGLKLCHSGRALWMDALRMAASSDDKYLYVAGLNTNAGGQSPGKPLPCVVRVDAATRSKMEVFLGRKDQAGIKDGLLTAPRGIAVSKGLVYVADHGSGRVVVFDEKTRKQVGEFKVATPDTLGVDAKTGAVYVCSTTRVPPPNINRPGTYPAKLSKVESFKSGKVLYSLDLPNAPREAYLFSLDTSVKPVRMWASGSGRSRHMILCVEDVGGKLVMKGDLRSGGTTIMGPNDMTFDRKRGLLYVKYRGLAKGGRGWGAVGWARIDETTGKIVKRLKFNGITQLYPAEDGKLFTWTYGTGLRAWGHNNEKMKWPGLGKPALQIHPQMTFTIRGLFVRKSDELWLVPQLSVSRWSQLRVVGLDGKTKRTVVWQCYMGATPRVDQYGNIYLADMVKPPDRSSPEFFDGKIAPPRPRKDIYTDKYWYSYMYGSIVKFPPEGGAIWSCPPDAVELKRGGKLPPPPPPGTAFLKKPKIKVKAHVGFTGHQQATLQGAEWYRFGYSPYSATTDTCTTSCMCEGAGFDVDLFGRVFFPNAGQYRVEMIDTNNNRIANIGKYGNADSGGPDATVKKPAIPFAWPLTVAVSDDYAYVADTISKRIVRVKLGCAAAEQCDIR